MNCTADTTMTAPAITKYEAAVQQRELRAADDEKQTSGQQREAQQYAPCSQRG